MVSISGIRGIVGETFTPEVVQRYVSAFGSTLSRGSEVVLGRDSRTSGPWVSDLAAATLQAMGHHATVVGLCATPTLGYAVRARRAAGGIMVTASHNPVPWNALKMFGADGGFVRPTTARRIFAVADSGRVRYADYRRPGRRRDDPALVRHHLRAALKLVPKRARHLGLNIVLDTVNGAGSVLTPEFLETVGCRVHLLNGDPTGLFAHRPEPLAKNIRGLRREVRRRRADLGIAVDPDVDRVAFVDEHGHAIGEELSLGIATAHVLQWRPGPVVVNLSTSRVSEDLAREAGQRFYRTPVGEAHVAHKMHLVNAAVGGEGNGGVIYPRLHPGRDALVGIAFLLAHMSRRQEPVSEIVRALPRWHLVRAAVPRPENYEAQLESFLRALPKGRVDRRDGIRVDWPDGWIQMRKSNTEPIVRILSEARTPSGARALLADARARLNL
jgi:phosphomannomutase